MEETNAKIPLFKKIDKAVFERLDKFKQTPNYNNLLDFYSGMEEEQQKAFKGGILLTLGLIPTLALSLLWWQNGKLKSDLALRTQIITRANEIIGQKRGIQEIKFNILSGNPIDSDSMMTSRLSTILSGTGVDLNKIQVKDFNSASISTEVFKSEADFSFSNLSTEELMNIFIAMIQREKFRVSDVAIKRNNDTGLLQGRFHAVHFSNVQASGGEE